MKVNLEKKMKNYGKNVLSRKESKGAERKKRRKVQNLRRAIRAQRAARAAEFDAIIAEEMEKQKIMDEYMEMSQEIQGEEYLTPSGE